MPELTSAAHEVLEKLLPSLYTVLAQHVARVKELCPKDSSDVQCRVDALSKVMLGLHSGDPGYKKFDKRYFPDVSIDGGAGADGYSASSCWSRLEGSDKQVIACIAAVRILMLHEGRFENDILENVYYYSLNLSDGIVALGFCMDMPETSLALREALVKVLEIDDESDLKVLSGQVKTYYDLEMRDKAKLIILAMMPGESYSAESIVARNLMEMNFENRVIRFLLESVAKSNTVLVETTGAFGDKVKEYCATTKPSVLEGVTPLLTDSFGKVVVMPDFDHRCGSVRLSGHYYDKKRMSILQQLLVIIDYGAAKQVEASTRIVWQVNLLHDGLSLSRVYGQFYVFAEALRLHELSSAGQVERNPAYMCSSKPFSEGYTQPRSDMFRLEVFRFVRGLMDWNERYLSEGIVGIRNKEKHGLVFQLQENLAQVLILLSRPVADIVAQYKRIYASYLNMVSAHKEFPGIVFDVNKTFGKLYIESNCGDAKTGPVETREDRFSKDLIRDISLGGVVLIIFKTIWFGYMDHVALLAKSQKGKSKLSSGRVGDMYRKAVVDWMKLYGKVSTGTDWINELYLAKVAVRESVHCNRVYAQCCKEGLLDVAQPDSLEGLVDAFIDALIQAPDYETVKSLYDAVEKCGCFNQGQDEEPLVFFKALLLAKVVERKDIAIGSNMLPVNDFHLHKYDFWVYKKNPYFHQFLNGWCTDQSFFENVIGPVLCIINLAILDEDKNIASARQDKELYWQGKCESHWQEKCEKRRLGLLAEFRSFLYILLDAFRQCLGPHNSATDLGHEMDFSEIDPLVFDSDAFKRRFDSLQIKRPDISPPKQLGASATELSLFGGKQTQSGASPSPKRSQSCPNLSPQPAMLSDA